MKPLKINEVISAVNGTFINNINKNKIIITGISTDSRNISDGELFIPLVGENFDGHHFISEVYKKGVNLCLSERNDILVPEGKALILVKNTKQALMDLASYYRSLFSIPIIAVTGSVGKTSTKDMISSVLQERYKVLSTQGNFNNEIGVPLTIFNLSDEHEVAVIEMGMNHFGEIHNLSKIVKPHIAVITNIGVSHIENLGSREGILKAKSEIFDYMNKDGKVFLNGDDNLLRILENQLPFSIRFFGYNDNNDIYVKMVDLKGTIGIDASIALNDREIFIEIPSPGKHMLYNALAAICTGLELRMSEDEIKNGIKKYHSSKMRMNISKTKKDIYIINDVYNASPQSMKAAIDVLYELKEGRRKIAVLGDMLEMGSYSSQAHKEVGEYVAKSSLDYLFSVGKEAENISLGALDAGMNKDKIFVFANQEDLWNQLSSIIDTEDMILVKASRGMHLEKTVEKIEKVE